MARLPQDPAVKPAPIDVGTFENTQALTKKQRRACMSVTSHNIRRLLLQVENVRRLDRKYRPVAYFVEMPHGGAKGAAAIRGMSYATAYLSTALHLLTQRRSCRITYFLPSEVKKAVAGVSSASKLAVADLVMAFWPEVKEWPGFKIVEKTRKKKGRLIKEQDKAVSHDATDAGAVCIAAMRLESYTQLVEEAELGGARDARHERHISRA